MNNIKSLLIPLTTLLILLISCSKDDEAANNNGNLDLANAQNATEENEIPLEIIEKGVKIEGAEKVEGVAPTPNSDLTFSIIGGEEAFQESGLNLEFQGGQNIAGAYIQFKDVDGNASSTYFNVPSTAFNSGNDGKSSKSISLSSKSKSSAKIISQSSPTNSGQNNINIDFTGLPAGKFCYDICLYDEQAQIYKIVTKCITVEAWGGNSSVVGEWIFVRNEGGEESTNEGNPNSSSEIICENGSMITINNSSTEVKSDQIFVLNENGTYFEEYDEEFKILDFNRSVQECKEVQSTRKSKEKYSGQWAFNEEEGTLTVIDFKFEDFINPGSSRDFPNGSAYFDAVKVEVINGELIISEAEGDTVYKTIFKRK